MRFGKVSMLAVVVSTASIYLGPGYLGAGAVSAQEQPRFVVNGVVTKEDGTTLAWIGEPTYTQNQPLRVREGDNVGPYRVTKIREDRVELTGPAGSIVVRLYGSGSDGKAVAPEVAAKPPAPAMLGAPRQSAFKPGEARAWLDSVTDPRVRGSRGFRQILGN